MQPQSSNGYRMQWGRQITNSFVFSRIQKGNYDPYEEIANAIVIQACNDYKNAYRRHLRRSGIVEKPDYELVALENFFRSDWYKILTSVDGEYLMERLRKEVIEEQKKS